MAQRKKGRVVLTRQEADLAAEWLSAFTPETVPPMDAVLFRNLLAALQQDHEPVEAKRDAAIKAARALVDGVLEAEWNNGQLLNGVQVLDRKLAALRAAEERT